MSVYIFVEGGGDGPTTRALCRKGFADFFAKLLPGMARVKVIPCGGRQQTYDDFCTFLENSNPEDRSLIVVDAERSIAADVSVWEHLQQRPGDGWKKPAKAGENDAHLMVQTVESWFLADPEKLAEFYGKGFKVAKLPKPVNGLDVESHEKTKVFQGLNAAVKETKHGSYQKFHAFEVIGIIDPKKVCKVSRHARELTQRLSEILEP